MQFRTCFTLTLLASVPLFTIGCSPSQDAAESSAIPTAAGGANGTIRTQATGGSGLSTSGAVQSSSSGGTFGTTAASSSSVSVGGNSNALGGTSVLQPPAGGASSSTVVLSAGGGSKSFGGNSNLGTNTSKATGGGAIGGQSTGTGFNVSDSSGGKPNGSTVGGASAMGGNSSESATGGVKASGGSNEAGQSGGHAGASPAAGGTANGGTSASSSSAASGDCNDKSSFTKALTARYDGAFIPVTDSTKTYRATTNWWFKFSGQTVDVNQIGFKVGNPNAVDVGTSGNPAGYPAIYIGAYSGNNSTASNLPKQVSSLTSVPTVFLTNALSMDNSNFNAAYDVWFTATNAPLTLGKSSPGVGGAYLMVWLFDPEDRQPRGKNAHPEHKVDGVEGAWDVWVDATDPLCISYVSTTPLDSLSFDLNRFIRDAVTNGYGITDAMYLSVVFAGFEIWGGGDGLELKQFCAEVK
ncbi:MAG TPA: hypothetical protein VIV60_06400 [Polyangiaceae bacterium]